MRRERIYVAEGASDDHESLRQKDSYRTHLWKVLNTTTQEESRLGETFR